MAESNTSTASSIEQAEDVHGGDLILIPAVALSHATNLDLEAAMSSTMSTNALPATNIPVAQADGVSENIDHTSAVLEVTAQPILDVESVAQTAASPIISRHSRAQYLSATFIKQNSSTKIGVGLRQDPDGALCISFIRDGSLLSLSPLRVGDKLLSVNGKSVATMDKAQAVGMISKSTGYITLVAYNPTGNPNYAETMVEKPSRESPVGLGLQRANQGSLKVSSITLNGLFSHSILNIDDRVLAINEMDCQNLEPRAAIEIVRGLERQVTLLTVTQGVVHAVSTSGNGLDSQILAATATADLVGVGTRTGLPRHLCLCTWLIILSMVIVSAIILVLGNK